MRLSRKGTVQASPAERFKHQAEEHTNRVFCSESQEKLDDQDIDSTLQDMQEAKQKLVELQAQPISRVNVAIVAFLFCLILERVWRVLWCTAYRRKVAAFSKEHDKIPFWDLVILQHDGAHYHVKALPELKIESPKAFDLLKAAMASWMPYRGKNGTIFYNTVGFWLHAFWFTRNSTTHNSLQLVKTAPPTAEGESHDNQEMFKVVNSPAVKHYIDKICNNTYPFGGGVDRKTKYREVCGNGFNMMPAKLAVDEIVGVLFEIYSDLEDMVRACV